ncbi:hypothetical protein niasHT_036342 [Heterodera trifolii]|uniref:Fido domain-containing protein n=1 Tax=Heterodera trifolii TaxID=157864 RepID=A0ABD2J0C9_9BILA
MAFDLIRHGGQNDRAAEEHLRQLQEGIYQSAFKYDALYCDILTPQFIYAKNSRVYRDPRDAGRLRTCNVSVGDHIPVDYRLVPLKMAELIEWFTKQEQHLGVIQLVAEMHYRLVYLHPFRNGNGRCARLLGNFVLVRKGFKPIILRERMLNCKQNAKITNVI